MVPIVAEARQDVGDSTGFGSEETFTKVVQWSGGNRSQPNEMD